MFLAKSSLYELDNTDTTNLTCFRCRKDSSTVKCDKAKMFFEEYDITLVFYGHKCQISNHSNRIGRRISEDLLDILHNKGYDVVEK